MAPVSGQSRQRDFVSLAIFTAAQAAVLEICDYLFHFLGVSSTTLPDAAMSAVFQTLFNRGSLYAYIQTFIWFVAAAAR